MIGLWLRYAPAALLSMKFSFKLPIPQSAVFKSGIRILCSMRHALCDLLFGGPIF
jgi:hypothetical protein